MIVLAIDTATSTSGVVLRTEEGTRARSIEWRDSFGSTVPAARALLEERGLEIGAVDAVVVPSGPGSFTGLRVGSAIALALARAGGTPLHAVPTLVGVAAARSPEGVERVVATLDARRDRWYGAVVSRTGGTWRVTDGPYDLAWDRIEALDPSAPTVGRESVAREDPLVARALADLVVAEPSRWRVEELRSFGLVYARPGVERG